MSRIIELTKTNFMKNLILTLGIIFAFVLTSYSQTADSTIKIEKKKYYQNGETKTPKQVETILANNPASSPEYQKYKKNARIAVPLLVTGTAILLTGTVINLVGSVQESQDVANGEIGGTYPNGLPIILVGAGVGIIAIPLVISANKHFKQSLSDYNSSFKSVSSRPLQFNLMVNSNGLGIRMQF
jgi:hypothetical protein